MAIAARARTDAPSLDRMLDNGLHVLVQEVHTAPLVTVWCWYRVGSRDEPAGQTGVSHWVEHMNFKGTTRIPRDKVKGIVERYGGYWNGYTWIDQTAYVETAPRDTLDHMLFIEAERMASCLYHPDDCESERTVIISELKGGENDPEQLLDQEVTATAIHAHPYRHPTIGWLADIETMTRADLYSHYRRFYVPNNATLVVVGDVSADDVFAAVRRHFGSIEPREVGRRLRTREPEQLGERRVTVERDGQTAYVKVAYHAPAVHDADFVPLLVLDAVLSGAKGLNLWASFRTPPPQRSARLYRRLVDSGLASAVSGSLLPTEDPFLYGISATVTNGVSPASVEEALCAELDRVRREGVTAAELQKARTQLRARMLFEQDSIANIAHQLGYFDAIGAGPWYVALPGRLAAVTLDDVARAAARLAPSKRTVGWFVPARA